MVSTKHNTQELWWNWKMLAFDGINQAPIATKRSDHHLDASYKLLLPCSTPIPTAPTDVSQFLDSAKTSLVDTAWSTLERKNLLLPVVGTTALMINATSSTHCLFNHLISPVFWAKNKALSACWSSAKKVLASSGLGQHGAPTRP